MHRTIGLVALLALPACGGKTEDRNETPKGSTEKPVEPKRPQPEPPDARPADRKPTGVPRPQDKLEVTLDGAPQKMQSALAVRDWDGTIKIEVSSAPLGCADLADRPNVPGELAFHVRLSEALQTDGKLKREMRQTVFDGMTTPKAGPAEGEGDATPDKPTTLIVDFESENMTSDEKKKKLVVKGTIDALGCAPTKRTTLPKEMDATLEVAGVKRPIRGAVVEKTGDWPVLRLFTGAEGCKDVPNAPTSDVSIQFVWFKPDKLGQINLAGRLIGEKMDIKFDPAKARITPMPAAAGEIGFDVDVVVADYPVKLSGKVTAIQCPK